MQENIIIQIGATITDLEQALNQASNQVSNFGDRVTSLGKTMAASFGAGALAVGGAIGYSVNEFAKFDTEMRKAGAIAGANAKELDDMKKSAIELGGATSQSASSVAVAMTELSAKGFNANQVIAAMPGIISAAEASGEDLALAADTVASALNIFGLEAAESGRVADVLAETANTSAAGIGDLGYVLKYAGAPAAALGISLEEVAAAAGVMTSAGLDGSNAGTALRASLLALNNPAKAQEKIMAGLGFSMQDNEGKTKNLATIVGDLTASMEGMTEAQKVATLAKLVGTEAVSGFLSLTKAGPAEINKMAESLRNSGGASAEAAAQMKAGIGGAFEQLSGSFESLVLILGEQLAPTIQDIAVFITDLFTKFSKLSEDVQAFIAKSMLVTTAVLALGFGFGLLITGVGMVISAIGTITATLAALATTMGVTGGALGLLKAAFAVLTGPIGITIAAVIAIVAALVLAYKKVDWFRDGVNKAWAEIKAATAVAFEAIKVVVTKVMNAIKVFVGDVLAKLKAFWSEHGASITKLAKDSFNTIWANIKSIMGYIQGIFQAVWPIISNTVQVAWALMKTIITSALDIILGIIGTVMNVLEGDWKGAWDSLKKIVTDVWDNIMKYLGGIDLGQIGKDIIAGLIKGIGSMTKAVTDTVKRIADSIPEGIKKILGIHSPSRVTEALGGFVGEGFANGIIGSANQVQKATTALAGVSKTAMEMAAPREKSSRKTKSRAKKLVAVLMATKAPKFKLNEVIL